MTTAVAAPPAPDRPPVRRRLRRWWIALAVLGPAVAVLGLLVLGMGQDTRYIRSPLLARQAPGFTLPLFDGGTLRLDDLRGQVVLVNFWASWCPPCRAEARMLEAVWREYSDRGVVFVGVNTQDQEAPARAFIEEFGLTYPNGMDSGSRIAVDYGVWGLPEAFFLDRKGRITYKHVGAIGPETLRAKLEEALGGIVSAAEGRGEYQSTR